MTAPSYRTTLPPPYRTKLVQTNARVHAAEMDGDRVKSACEKVRPALGIAPGHTGSFLMKFESGRCTFAESKRFLPSTNAEAIADLAASLELAPDFYGSIEVQLEDGVPVRVLPTASVRLAK